MVTGKAILSIHLTSYGIRYNVLMFKKNLEINSLEIFLLDVGGMNISYKIIKLQATKAERLQRLQRLVGKLNSCIEQSKYVKVEFCYRPLSVVCSDRGMHIDRRQKLTGSSYKVTVFLKSPRSTVRSQFLVIALPGLHLIPLFMWPQIIRPLSLIRGLFWPTEQLNQIDPMATCFIVQQIAVRIPPKPESAIFGSLKALNTRLLPRKEHGGGEQSTGQHHCILLKMELRHTRGGSHRLLCVTITC